MRNTVKVREVILLAGLFIPLSLISARMAVANDIPALTFAMTVTIVAPPCVINNNRPIEVEFGDVMTTRVNGDNYKMPINYTLSCTKGAPNAMKLQVKGPTAGFDNTLLWTNKGGLGIELRQGVGKLAVNRWINFTYPNKPELWAVPVKQPGTILKGGEFIAVATLAVDYQ